MLEESSKTLENFYSNFENKKTLRTWCLYRKRDP